jgi:hypothetical protein
MLLVAAGLDRWKNGIMPTLEQILQDLHDAAKPVQISWLWDGGIEVNAGAEERNFGSASEVLPWLQHWYGLGSRDARSDELETELQKIYDFGDQRHHPRRRQRHPSDRPGYESIPWGVNRKLAERQHRTGVKSRAQRISARPESDGQFRVKLSKNRVVVH